MADCLSREYPQTSQAVALLSGLRVLNANFFSGGSQSHASEWVTLDNALSDYFSALTALIGTSVPVLERSYSEAVDEFITAAASFHGLNYRLRTWFLLLVYDGINLHCRRANTPPLTSFQAERLQEIALCLPPSAAIAATQTLEYIRDYHLKYFLNKDTKISTKRGIDALQMLASEI